MENTSVGAFNQEEALLHDCENFADSWFAALICCEAVRGMGMCLQCVSPGHLAAQRLPQVLPGPAGEVLRRAAVADGPPHGDTGWVQYSIVTKQYSIVQCCGRLSTHGDTGWGATTDIN